MSAAALSFARSSARSKKFVFDPILLLATAGILLMGLVMVTSASISVADRQMHEPLYYLGRQSIGLTLGLAAAIVMMLIPTQVWERLAMPLLLLGFLFLVIVLIPGIGHEVNGSRRWLRLGVMNFQASELARVLLLTYLASYVVRRQAELKQDIRGFLKPLAILMAAAALLLLEPDFGAATVLMTTGLGVLFLAGVKLRHFLALVALAASGMAVIAVTSAYRLKRLTAFLDPFADPRAGPPADHEGRVRIVGRRVRPYVVRDGGGELLHVGAVVAVLRDRLAAAEGDHGRAQVVELAAGIIEVVLARDLLPAGFEDPAQEVTDERTSGVADRERRRRVGRHELDIDDPRRPSGDTTP
jgi:hypothetical protein